MAYSFISPVPLSRPSHLVSSSRTAHARSNNATNVAKAPHRRTRGPQTVMLFDFLFRKPDIIDIEALSEHYPAIRIDGLCKTYIQKLKGRKKETRKITAVDHLSFVVPRGSIFGLLGPNSCGKTTTMRCMGTLEKPDSGRIEYFGIDAVKNGLLARNMVGYVMQSAGVDKVLTGREHLDLFADLAHLERVEKEETIEAVVDLLGLVDFIDLQTGVYSGGMLRRLDLAIALLNRPSILILDEPTVGLDIDSRRVIWDILLYWRKCGGTVLLSSHYLEEVDLLCDEIAIMEKGVMIAKGTPAELKNGLGGDRISVRLSEFTGADKAEAALRAMQEKHLIIDGTINQMRHNTLELVVNPDDANIGRDIVQALSEIGHEKLFSFSQSKPSLDDVYLSATGKSLSDADVQAKISRTERSLRKENMR